jgi:hypothetical protein
MDINQDGMVSQDEFVNGLTIAKRSNADISMYMKKQKGMKEELTKGLVMKLVEQGIAAHMRKGFRVRNVANNQTIMKQ